MAAQATSCAPKKFSETECKIECETECGIQCEIECEIECETECEIECDRQAPDFIVFLRPARRSGLSVFRTNGSRPAGRSGLSRVLFLFLRQASRIYCF